MAEVDFPKVYRSIREKHGHYMAAVEELGKVLKEEGPLDEKTSQLIQLAAAATIRSEGAVHSHVRRALNLGVKPEEVYHTLILLTSTIGFPTVAAALSWVEDVIQGLSADP